MRLDVEDADTENSGPKKPPGAEIVDSGDVEELDTGVNVEVAAGGVVAGLEGVTSAGDAVEVCACVLSCAVEMSTVATGEPEGSTKVNAARVGVLVGSVTGTTKGMPVSAAWTPGGVEDVFTASGVFAE